MTSVKIKDLKQQEEEGILVPLVLKSGYSNDPAIPYKEKAIIIPRNLLSNTNYLLSTNVTEPSNLNYKISNIQAILNNITEMLSFQIMHQCPEDLKETTEVIEKVREDIEKQTTHLTKLLEQNRQNLKEDNKLIKDLAEAKYQTIIEGENRITSILNEKKDSNTEELIKKISEQDTKIESLQDSLKRVIELVDKQHKEVLDKLKEHLG